MSWPLRQRHGQLWKPMSLCDVATSTLSRKFTILLRLTSPSRLCKAITIAFAPFRLTCRQRDIQLWKPMSFCAVAASTLSIYFVTAVAILLDQLQFYCGNFTEYSWISFAAFYLSLHFIYSLFSMPINRYTGSLFYILLTISIHIVCKNRNI